MANDLNKVLLIGRMTRDPEFKSVNGSSVVNFSIANNRVYVTNGEKKRKLIISTALHGADLLTF